MFGSMNRRTVMLALALGLVIDSWAYRGHYSAATVRGAHAIGEHVAHMNWRTVLTS